MNQFTWNLLYPGGERIENMVLWNGVPGNILASPGTYYARIRLGTDSVDKEFTLLADPNFRISESDYRQQFDFLVSVRDKFNEVQRTVRDIRAIRAQISDFTGRQDRNAVKEIKPLVDSINKKLTAIEEALYQTKAKSSQDVLNYPIKLNDKLAGVFNAANSGNMPPSQQVKDVFTELALKVDAELGKFQALQVQEIGSLNALIRQKELPVIGIKKEK
jgi:hypothetical protein